MEPNQTPDQRPAKQEQSSDWQQDLINRLAFAAVNEQKRARRWGIFFKLLTFAYITAILYIYTPDADIDMVGAEKHTALVELKGIIAPGKDASADNVMVVCQQNPNLCHLPLRLSHKGFQFAIGCLLRIL